MTHALRETALLAGSTAEDLSGLMARGELRTQSFAASQVLAVEDDPCTAVGIVLAGSVHIQRAYPNGRVVTLESFGPGESFGEALVFSAAGRYPATVITGGEPAAVAFLAREGVVRLCRESPEFLNNFLRLLSDKVLLLNRRIKGLTYQTVRQKVADFILDAYRTQGQRMVHVTQSRAEMADRLGIPQPSLSRELAAMKADGWIDFDRRTIEVRDPEALAAAVAG